MRHRGAPRVGSALEQRGGAVGRLAADAGVDALVDGIVPESDHPRETTMRADSPRTDT